jgi:hypothetical protein
VSGALDAIDRAAELMRAEGIPPSQMYFCQGQYLRRVLAGETMPAAPAAPALSPAVLVAVAAVVNGTAGADAPPTAASALGPAWAKALAEVNRETEG